MTAIPELRAPCWHGDSRSCRCEEGGSEWGRALVALRPRVALVCAACGAAFTARASRQQPARTCSPRCRQQLYRDRKREVTAPDPGE